MGLCPLAAVLHESTFVFMCVACCLPQTLKKSSTYHSHNGSTAPRPPPVPPDHRCRLWALEYASLELRADREVVLEAVQQDGRALQYASEELQADREVVLAAVQQNGWAIEHASPELRADREVRLAARRSKMRTWLK